jgi:dipeptidyl aminopeptidase/acylaminoacyl peptidase
MRLTVLGIPALIAGLSCLPLNAQEPESPPMTRQQIGNLVIKGIPAIPGELADRMNQYQNVRAAGFADWFPNNGGLLIATRFGNTAQLHQVEKPLGMRSQLTFFDDPVAYGEFGPAGAENLILFTKDTAGNEVDQIHVFDISTGLSRMISDGTSVHRGVAWANQSPLIAYSNNARNGRDWDIYTQSVFEGPETRKMVFEGEGSWWVADWDVADAKLLIGNYISASESSLHILDLASGATTQVHADITEPVSYGSAAFSRDSDGLFYTSDHRRQFKGLFYYDPVHNVSKPLMEDIAWDVEAFDMSKDGRLMALSVNEDGLSTVYLLNLKTLEKEHLGIPPGIVRGLNIRDDGERIGFSLHQSTGPGDVYVWKRAERELVRWTRSEVGGLPVEKFIGSELIHYPTFDNDSDGKRRTIPAFVQKPRTPGPWPVLIEIHGGPESQARPYFGSFHQFLLNELGIAIIQPNVRGSTGYGRDFHRLDDGKLREDSVKDIGALLGWIEGQPDFDASRVVVSGGSYGGYMVYATMAMFPEKIAGGISSVGISNFVTFLESTSEYRRDLRRSEYGDERDPEMRAFLESISPTTNADRIVKPLFVKQGKNDPRVPYMEAEQIVEAARQNGQDVWYLLALDEGHGFARKENRDYSQAATVLFLQKVLGLDSSATAESN